MYQFFQYLCLFHLFVKQVCTAVSLEEHTMLLCKEMTIEDSQEN